MITPHRLDELRAQRDAAEAARRRAHHETEQRLQALRDYGAWLAAERLSWPQIETIVTEIAAAALDPDRWQAAAARLVREHGLPVELRSYEEWVALVGQIETVAMMVTGER